MCMREEAYSIVFVVPPTFTELRKNRSATEVSNEKCVADFTTLI